MDPSNTSIKCQKFPDTISLDLRFKTEEKCRLAQTNEVARLANQEVSLPVLNATEFGNADLNLRTVVH